MKVLFVTNMLPVPDYQYFGIHVKEQIDNLLNEGEIVGEVYFINGRASKWNYVNSIWKVKEKIESFKPDLIHVHYGISGIFTLFSSINIPLVVTLHSGEIYRKKSWINHVLQKSFTKLVISKADKVIILNDDMQALLSNYSSKLIKIPCGINISEFAPMEGLRDKSSFTVGFPANRNRPEKNYVFFEKVINILSKDYNITVIEFNNMSRRQVVESMNKLDVLCMTSTIEGSPQTVKEAMACNVPVVSSLVGDVDDLLEDVANSFVIDVFDETLFANAIKKIFEVPFEIRKSKGREKLRTLKLDTESVTNRLSELYKSLLK